MNKITLATLTGPQIVDSYPTKCPQLFIHRPLEGDTGEWKITHVPTGYAILTSKKLKWAKSACAIMSEIQGWETLTVESAKEFFNKNYNILCQGRDVALGGPSNL